jgi:hypothetical protein
VSYYHHHRLWNGYVGTFDDFVEAFLADVREYLQAHNSLNYMSSARNISCLESNEFYIVLPISLKLTNSRVNFISNVEILTFTS